MYEVINLDTDESCGVYERLSEAQGCVESDKLAEYQIWFGVFDRGYFEEHFIVGSRYLPRQLDDAIGGYGRCC